MEKKLVSIIMPVYNKERFVSGAIESIINQTYQNWELLIIDDGSTDASAGICDHYEAEDTRIRVIHTKNNGVSAARNLGLKLSKGEYVEFIDGDDEYTNRRTEDLLASITESDCDFALGGAQFLYDTFKEEYKLEFRNYSYKEVLFEYITSCKIVPWLFNTSCMGVYKRDIIKSAGLTFEEQLRYGEDSLFTLSYLKQCQRVCCLNEVLYLCNRRKENKSAVTFIYWDVYKFGLRYCMEFCEMIDCGSLGEQEKKQLGQYFTNLLILYLVYLGSYMPNMAYSDVKSRLCEVTHCQETILLVRYYKRINRKNSVLIPLFLRLKWIWPLALILKQKGRKFLMNRKKNGIEVDFCSVHR